MSVPPVPIPIPIRSRSTVAATPPVAAGRPNRLDANKENGGIGSTGVPRPIKPRVNGGHQLVHDMESSSKHPSALASSLRRPTHSIVSEKEKESHSLHTMPPPPLPPARPVPAPIPVIHANTTTNAHDRSAITHARAVTQMPTTNSVAPVSSSSSAASSSSSALISPSTASNIVPPTSSSSSSTSSKLADRVVTKWRQFTSTRVDDLSLEHRAQQFLIRHHLHRWHSHTYETKERWKASITHRTKSRFHFLKTCFERWHQRIVQQRPKRIEMQLQQRKALEYEKFRRRGHAIRRWKLYYVNRVLQSDQIERCENVRQHHLLRDAFRSWVSRLDRLSTASRNESILHATCRMRLLHDVWRSWKSSQGESALSRLQAGLARKFAYKSVLRRLMRRWRHQAGQADRRNAILTQFESAQRTRRINTLFRSWRHARRRQVSLAQLIEHRSSIAIRQALELVWSNWCHLVRRDRSIERIEHVTLHKLNRTQLHHAIHVWHTRMKLLRARRLLGVRAFALLRSKWIVWRRTLALHRSDTKRHTLARHHHLWHTFERCIHKWRQYSNDSNKRRELLEHAEQAWSHRHAVEAIRRWSQLTRRNNRRRELSQRAVLALDAYRFRIGLSALRQLVARSHQKRHHHHALLLHARIHAFNVWRRWTRSRLDDDTKLRRAKRFRYLQLLQRPFQAWQRSTREESILAIRMLMTRATPLLKRRKESIWRTWLHLARDSRTSRLRVERACSFDRMKLLHQSFAYWYELYHTQHSERIFEERARRHWKIRFETRIMRAWDGYAYAQRFQRTRIQDGIECIRQRLRLIQLRHTLQHWHQRRLQRELHRSWYEKAELHHARSIVLRAYRHIQTIFGERRLRAQHVARLASRVDARQMRKFLYIWLGSFGERRRQLQRHMLALQFWSRRVMGLAWRGWLKYHARHRWKVGRMEQALSFRRDRLRKVGLRCWLQAGLELAETTLEIQHRGASGNHGGGNDAHETNPFSDIHQRRLTLKYARIWRERVRQRRQVDQRIHGFQRRIVHLLPFAPASRPMPITIPPELPPLLSSTSTTLGGIDHHAGPPPPPNPSSSSHSHVPPSEFAALFPSSIGQVRPAPRMPLDLLVDFPIQLPLRPITYGRAAINNDNLTQQSNSHQSHGFHSPLVQSAPIVPHHGGLVATPSMAVPDGSIIADAISHGTSPSVASKLAALEDHLHRLLTWKQDAHQRRFELAELERQSSSLGLVVDDAHLTQLRASVSSDRDHRPYYTEQVKQIQKQIAEMITSMETHE